MKKVIRTALALVLCATMLFGNILTVFAAGTTNVTVTIRWDDGDDADGLRPASVSIPLEQYFTSLGFSMLYEGETAELDENNGWTYTYSDLPLEEYGEKVSYVLRSVNMYSVNNYGTPSITGPTNDWTFTYTHEPEKTAVSVNVSWVGDDDNTSARSESVNVELKAGTGTISQQTLSEGNSWGHKWEGLNKNQKGQPIDYSIDVTSPTPDNYDRAISGSGNNWTVTYTYKQAAEPDPDPDTTSVTVMILWNDENDKDDLRKTVAPVSVVLVKDYVSFPGIADSEVGLPVELSSGNDWSYTWDGLPTVEGSRAWAEPLMYYVRLAGPITAPDGYTVGELYEDSGIWYIEYTHVPAAPPEETTEVSLTVKWNDNDNAENTRPSSLSVNLYASYGGETYPYDTVSLSGDSDTWTHMWTDLPVMIGEYKVKYFPYGGGNLDDNLNVADYGMPEITSDETDWTFTYELNEDHTPKIVDVVVKVEWKDVSPDERPDEVFVTLYKNGTEPINPVIRVTAAGGWTYTWESLPTEENSVPIVYTVGQEKVDGYALSYQYTNPSDPGGKEGKITCVITNTEIEEVTITVKVEWTDAQYANRPESGIPVSIFYGTAYSDPEAGVLRDPQRYPNSGALLNDDPDPEKSWTYTWTLPEYANRATLTKYIYIVLAEMPEGYSLDIRREGNTFILYNVSPCTTTHFDIYKVWDDGDDIDGERPDSIIVDVYTRESNNAGSAWEPYEMGVVLTASNGWRITLSEVPYTPDVQYKVEEHGAEGYALISNKQTGALSDGDYTFTLTNYHSPKAQPPSMATGNLQISKTVTGAGDKNKAFTFTAKLSGTYTDSNGNTLDASKLSGKYGDLTFKDGEASVTLKHGQSAVAQGLPAGIKYTVTEAEANKDGYTTTATGAEGTIPAGATIEAAFINSLPTATKDVPKTGDDNDMVLWVALMASSLAGITGALCAGKGPLPRKKKRSL